MRFLLIGGTGFIGPHVANGLTRRGHEVVVFHRGHTPAPAGVREVIGDRRHLEAHARELRRIGAAVVVDLALSSGRQARVLVDVFRRSAARVVALSSADVYRACGITHGFEDGDLEPVPLTESSRLRTRLQTYPPAQLQALQQVFGWVDDEYDKIPVEQEILADADLPGTVLRLPMVYGPGDPLHRFHPVVKRVVGGWQQIPVSSAVAGWRATKGYVEDVGGAIALAATSHGAVGRTYNLGEPDTLTELEWMERIARTLDWRGRFVVLPDADVPAHLRAPGNTAQHWVMDTSRIRQELGFAETVSRDEAIARTVAWARANPPGDLPFHHFDDASEHAACARGNDTGGSAAS